MHLGDGGGGDRLPVERGEDRLRVAAELLLQDGRQLLVVDGRGGVLQPGKLGDERRRQDVDSNAIGSSPSETGRRRYHSPARRHQAEDTRRRILDAARDRFRRGGYPGTTLEAIAAGAGFSVKTLVAAFASKRGILAALVDPLLSPHISGELLDELRSTRDPRHRIELVARLTRRVYETMAPEFDLLHGLLRHRAGAGRHQQLQEALLRPGLALVALLALG